MTLKLEREGSFRLTEKKKERVIFNSRKQALSPPRILGSHKHSLSSLPLCYFGDIELFEACLVSLIMMTLLLLGHV